SFMVEASFGGQAPPSLIVKASFGRQAPPSLYGRNELRRGKPSCAGRLRASIAPPCLAEARESPGAKVHVALRGQCRRAKGTPPRARRGFFEHSVCRCERVTVRSNRLRPCSSSPRYRLCARASTRLPSRRLCSPCWLL